MAKAKNFAELIRKKLAKDADLAALVDQESFNAQVATEIYEARECAGLTQAELAALVGTHQSVIARLESADYDGHSLSMLKKIAQALNKSLRVEFYAPPAFVSASKKLRTCASMWAEAKVWKPTATLKNVRVKVTK